MRENFPRYAVSCPFCQKAIAGSDIHLDDNFAFCRSCEDGFRIADEWQEKVNHNEAALPSSPPSGFKIEDRQNSFALIYKKSSPIGLILIIFSLPFILLPANFLLYPQFSEGLSFGKSILAMPFILCGLLAVWIGAVKLLGTHRIEVKPSGEGILSTEVGPLKTTQKFRWNEVKSTRVCWSRSSSANSSTVQLTPELVLIGREKTRFPTYFNREECQYMALFLSSKLVKRR